MRNALRPDGRSFPFAVPYAGGILSGQGMLVGAFFGVAAVNGAQNEVIECACQGEFSLTKEPSLAIAAGARVFWDNTNRRITTTATGNFAAGICTRAALAADTEVAVWIERVPASGA
jgi:predicted RecA/RadA family phage recombinase